MVEFYQFDSFFGVNRQVFWSMGIHNQFKMLNFIKLSSQNEFNSILFHHFLCLLNKDFQLYSVCPFKRFYIGMKAKSCAEKHEGKLLRYISRSPHLFIGFTKILQKFKPFQKIFYSLKFVKFNRKEISLQCQKRCRKFCNFLD